MKKRSAITTLIFVFVFVAMINKIVNERNVQHLGQAFSEINDDRLLAESYICQLTELIYKKKIALIRHENAAYNAEDKREMQKQTLEMTEIAGKYASTKLTENERNIFENGEHLIELTLVAGCYQKLAHMRG